MIRAERNAFEHGRAVVIRRREAEARARYEVWEVARQRGSQRVFVAREREQLCAAGDGLQAASGGMPSPS
jgi:hypothetical protein